MPQGGSRTRRVGSGIPMTVLATSRPAAPLRLIGRSSLVFDWRPGDELTVLEVSNNAAELMRAGVFERCFAQSLVRTWMGNGSVDTSRLKFLLRCADRKKLQALADPLPGPGPFTIWRGV